VGYKGGRAILDIVVLSFYRYINLMTHLLSNRCIYTLLHLVSISLCVCCW